MSFEEYYHNTKEKIEEYLSDYIKSKYVAERANVASYILKGGKRLRGVLACLVAQGFGAQLDYALDAGAAIELIHSASLAHDDVIDRDEKRRGEPAAWVQFSVARAVLAGHVIISHALDMMNKYGMEAWNLAISMWKNLAQGVLEEVFTGRFSVKDSYIQVVRLKTGALFGGAAALGTIVARKYDYVDRMYGWGEQLGVLYQIADDLVDLSRLDFQYLPKIGDPLKIADPYLLALYLTDGQIGLVFEKGEIIRLALEKLRIQVGELEHRIPFTVKNEYFDALREVPEYFVTRMLEEAKLEW